MAGNRRRTGARPHSASENHSAVTAASSNSGSNSKQLSNNNESGRNIAASQYIHRNQIKIVSEPEAAEVVNFKELLETNPINFRKDRLLVKQIKKIFAEGIKLDDP